MSKKSDQNPRKKPVQKRSQETVDVILTAATHILGSLGFDSATTNRIAEKAGISIGSLYQYFPNKEALAGALIDKYVRRHADKFEALLIEMRGRPVKEMVQEIAEEVVQMYMGNRKFLNVMGILIPKIDRIPSVVEARKKIVTTLADELRARSSEIKHPDPEFASFVILNGAMGVIQFILYDPEMKIDQQKLADELARMALAYLFSYS